MLSTEIPLLDSCDDDWTWNVREKSHEVKLSGEKKRTAQFHPNWSNGTAAVRGNKVLQNGARYYWEIVIPSRVFGTSMMLGVATKKARLHIDAFVNIIGEDDQGWGLSHRGLLWHDGKSRKYTKPFKENESTKIGIMFDGIKGTLTYYKDGVSLGEAFTGLNHVKEDLYPMVASTAARTEMRIGVRKRSYSCLQDRCRVLIAKRLRTRRCLDVILLPKQLKSYVADYMQT
ncbi:SPRY domain-containing SOCS box protein 3-like [Amphiura filiformis]|uniref:SPRY domain-containing SOCS box protein 3-like n=1 Tax=Amphiura filiformis TaxID=82378 RepID=UPI003B21D754